MEEMFDIGMKASNFKHLKEIYRLEDSSYDAKLEYQQQLKESNPEVYTQVLDLKKRLESEIVNVKQAMLYGEDPIINEKLFHNV